MYRDHATGPNTHHRAPGSADQAGPGTNAQEVEEEEDESVFIAGFGEFGETSANRKSLQLQKDPQLDKQSGHRISIWNKSDRRIISGNAGSLHSVGCLLYIEMVSSVDCNIF